MQTGAITQYIDVAQVVLYVFWVFFFGLIFYLRREDKREGYPLVYDGEQNRPYLNFPPIPAAKTFILADGSTVEAPRPILSLRKSTLCLWLAGKALLSRRRATPCSQASGQARMPIGRTCRIA